MSGLDALIAKSIKSIVKDNLGDATFERIEKRLFERHGIGFTQAVEDFGKLDVVLREFFGDGAVGIERRIIDKIVILEESKRNEKKWITLEDSRLIELMLRSLGDDDKKNLINSAIGEPLIISDMLEISKIPQTSGYRKINALIDDGILIPQGYVTTHDGKRVTKYKAVFENISISIEKNKIVVKVQPTLESIKNSHIMQIVCT
ncbi:MAG TPA: transcriptional regulator [Candidatus Nitrosotalea sp.]|nr:transcriptional regulator [Candidatus Nitrosotalea sp.]